MKRIFSLVLAVVICLLSFSSCSGPAKVQVNGTKIDNEVYAYFEDLHTGNKDEIKKSISRYVTINSEFHNRGLNLTPAQKSGLSQEVDKLWHLYGVHFKNIGVSKQTVYKIESSDLYEDVLFEYYYGQGGVEPVSEELLKKYFSQNYIAISYATEYLFNIDENGNMIPMTDNEEAVIIGAFTEAAELVNSGDEIEMTTSNTVNNALINSSYDGTFPSGFYKEVANIKVGSASTVVLGDYVFLVKRIDVFDETYNYYKKHRMDCLRVARGQAFENMINYWSQFYVVI